MSRFRGLLIATAAVCSAADRDALHVREAGAAFALGGSDPADRCLRMDPLLGAAVQTLGGMGFMRRTVSERLYREVKVTMIGGAEELKRERAARQLGL